MLFRSPVTAAIFVIEMEDVLVASMVFLGVHLSSSSKIFNFNSTFSVAASTTSSASFTPSIRLGLVLILPSVDCFCSSVRLPLATCRSGDETGRDY